MTGSSQTRPTVHRRWPTLVATGGVLALLAVGAVAYLSGRPVEPGFDSPEGIATLLADRGAACEDFADDDEGRADERGVCYVNGERIIIATFASPDEAEAHWERQAGAATENQTIGMVIGDRWTISGHARAYLRQAAEVLDAEYRTN